MLRIRGYAVESAATRVCREAGARVTTNVMIRDMDLAAPEAWEGRRIEIVADGLPLFGGAQLAVDATLVSPLYHQCLEQTLQTAQFWLLHVEEKKLLTPSLWVTTPEPVSSGRWSHEVSTFVRLFVRAKACSAARTFASSLLDVRTLGGADSEIPPSHEVVNNFRHAGLA